MTDNHIILGIHIQDRLKQVNDVQKIFTEYGCHIKTRLGMHDVSDGYCASTGIVILEMIGNPDEINGFMAKLNGIEGIEVQKMEFTHN